MNTALVARGRATGARVLRGVFGSAARGALPFRRRLLRAITLGWALLLTAAFAVTDHSASELLACELPILAGVVAAQLGAVGERVQAAALSAALAVAAAATAAVAGDAGVALVAFATAIVLTCWHEDRLAAATVLVTIALLQAVFGVLTPDESNTGVHAATRLAGLLIIAAAAAGPWRYNATRERALVAEREALSALAAISRRAGSSDDPRTLVVDGICELIGADSVGLCELQTPNTLAITAATSPALVGTQFALDGAPSGLSTVIATGEPLFITDTSDHPLTQHPAIRAAGLTSMLYQPVLDERGTAGVLVVGWHNRVAVVSEHGRSIIALAAAEAGAAVRRTADTAALQKLATTDALTGAHNRRVFDTELPEAVRHATQSGEPLAVAMLDLNGFKALNDTEGHNAGDQVLQRCVQLWTRELRPGDLLARIGGDEFAAILPGCTSANTGAVARRLKNALRDETRVGVAIGIATWNAQETPAELIRRADTLLYADKNQGKTASLPNPSTRATAWHDLPADPDLQAIADDLTRALAAPIVVLSLTNGDAQYILAQSGTTGPQLTDLTRAYCHYPATTGRELIITDTTLMPALKDHPSTKLGGRAYAGIPITKDGEIIGVACAIDSAPRPWTNQQTDHLRHVADHIASRLPHPDPATPRRQQR